MKPPVILIAIALIASFVAVVPIIFDGVKAVMSNLGIVVQMRQTAQDVVIFEVVK